MARKKFSELDKSEQLKTRKEAYKRWSMNPEGSNRRLTKIGLDLGMTKEEINHYKVVDKWDKRYRKSIGKINDETHEMKLKALEKANVKDLDKSARKIDEILEDAHIPEKWQLFIMHYLHSFNPTTASYKAGYGTKSKSVPFTILNDPRVKNAIKEIKVVMHTDLYLTAHDLLSEYSKIAFADMTDYVEFDNRRVKLKDSESVDGRLIVEVKQGKDGVTIKLADKLKAMEKLEKLFDVIPDKRLELDNKKYELQKRVIEKQLDENKDDDKEDSTIIINFS